MPPCCKSLEDIRAEFDGDRRRKTCSGTDERQRRKVAGAQERNHQECRKEDQRCTEIADEHQTSADKRGIDDEEQQVPARHDPIHRRCADKHKADFHQLRRLEGKRSDEDPVPRAVLLSAEHQVEEQQRNAKDCRRIANFFGAFQTPQRPSDRKEEKNADNNRKNFLFDAAGIRRRQNRHAHCTEEVGNRLHLIASSPHGAERPEHRPFEHDQRGKSKQHRRNVCRTDIHHELQHGEDLEYRQVKQYADMGVKLPTSTLNDWMHAVASKLDPVYEALRNDIRSSDYLQTDEVPWRIVDTPGKSRKGYAWQFLDSRPESHGLYFLYMNGSRAGSLPRAELRDFHGAIQTDGYGVYDYFELQDDVTLLGCMAHVRRKFTDAQSSHPELAVQAVKWLTLLYELEANLRAEGATYDKIAEERRSKAIPIMDAMEKWMENVHTQCTPSDPMGKALDYAYKLWPRLRRYALDGRYHIDNNPVERNQRPSVLGRKNYLFSKNDSGALDNAVFYSLIESCDIVGINPLQWLTDVLQNLHDDTPPEQIRLMLPYYYKKSRE